MDLSTKPLLEIIGSIEQFRKQENQCPFPFVQSLTSRIKGCLKAIQLVRIGGESLVIRAKNDETGEAECIKVARLDIQDPYRASPKKDDKSLARSRNGFFQMFNKKEEKELKENKNTKIARFMRGCTLQREITRLLLKDRPDFKVPLVIDFSLQPTLYLRQEWLINNPILVKLKNVKTLSQKLFFFIKLLNAIEYIHFNGIIHRDIKADNIMWDGARSIILLDWTLAKNVNETSNLTVSGTRAGTPGIAPQKFMSDADFGDANFSDDIYMLGACLWEFVIGENFPTLRVEATEKEIEEHRIKQLAFLPDILQPIFLKATEPEEGERYKTVVAMKNAVLKAIEFLKEEIIEDKKLPETTGIIVDNTIQTKDIDFCKKCECDLICKKFELCKLKMQSLLQLKKDKIL